jgi:hypothetical protein
VIGEGWIVVEVEQDVEGGGVPDGEVIFPFGAGGVVSGDGFFAAAKLAIKSTVLVPAILFCTNDQSDFSSPSATVIGELRQMISMNAQRNELDHACDG